MATQHAILDEEEIVLSELDDGELVEQMHDDLYDGLREEIVEGTSILLERKWSAGKRCSTSRWSKACESSAWISVTVSCSCPRCYLRPTR